MLFSQTLESFALASSTFQISFWEVWIPFTFVCWFSHTCRIFSLNSGHSGGSIFRQYARDMMIWWAVLCFSLKGLIFIFCKKDFFLYLPVLILWVNWNKNPVSLKTLSCYYFYCTFLPPEYFVFSSHFFFPACVFGFNFFHIRGFSYQVS